jgi:hypothetical protein
MFHYIEAFYDPCRRSKPEAEAQTVAASAEYIGELAPRRVWHGPAHGEWLLESERVV